MCDLLGKPEPVCQVDPYSSVLGHWRHQDPYSSVLGHWRHALPPSVLGRCLKVRDMGGLASCHTLLLLTFLLWMCAFYSEQFAVWCKLKGSFLRDMKACCPITKLSKTSAEVGFKSGTCKQNRILNVCRLLPFAGIFLCAFLLQHKVNSLHTVQYLGMLCSTYYSTLNELSTAVC